MSDGEGKLAPRRHFTPLAYIAPIDPNTDRSLQRRTRTILRPRPPHIAARLAGIGSIAFRSANLCHLSARVGDLLADPRTQRRTRTRSLRLPLAFNGGRFLDIYLCQCWNRGDRKSTRLNSSH